jgi:hypothetical protein
MKRLLNYDCEVYELVETLGSFGNNMKDDYCILLINIANSMLPCWYEIRMDSDATIWAYCGRDGEGIECNHHNMWETFSVHENVHALQIDVFDNVIGIDWKRFGIIKQSINN